MSLYADDMILCIEKTKDSDKNYSNICSNIVGTTDSHTKGSKSEKETQITCYITSIWNVIYSSKGTQIQKGSKLMDMEKRLVVAEGEEEGEGWTGSLGWLVQLTAF